MSRSLLRPSSLLRPIHRVISPPPSSIVAGRMDYSSIATPERCYVDFCLIPVRPVSSLITDPHLYFVLTCLHT